VWQISQIDLVEGVIAEAFVEPGEQVEGVVQAPRLLAVRDLKLVFEPRSLRHFHDDVPKIGILQPPQRDPFG